MKLGKLLNKLIDIADVSKTDFAIYMNMTPSGLSKILTGKRLPFLRERKEFAKQAAIYFTEEIYGYGCYVKFKKVFPLIYDFNSKNELEMFLIHAIEYTFSKDHAAANNDKMEYSGQELSFLGKRTILNMLCIILSDYLIEDEEIPLELYSTLPLFSRLFSDVFHRIKLSLLAGRKNLYFNHIFDFAHISANQREYDVEHLSVLVNMQQHFDLTLWEGNKEPNQFFLLLKGKCLLLFNIQIDGTPLMSFITHKSYIAIYLNTLMKKNVKKLSYGKEDVLGLLKEEPAIIENLFKNQSVHAIYSFLPVGYLLNEEEINTLEGDSEVKKAVLKLLQGMFDKKTEFYMTLDVITDFYKTGKVVVPMGGTVSIKPSERMAYLKRFTPYVREDKNQRFKIFKEDMPKMVLLALKGYSIVYFGNGEHSSEKIHILNTDILNKDFSQKVTDDGMENVLLNEDLWAIYMEKLQEGAYTFPF